MTFSGWILAKIKAIGGITELCKRMTPIPKRSIKLWIHEIQAPNYGNQLALCKALECELSELRGALGLPHTHFAELLLNKILPYGNSVDFPRKTGINSSRYEKWLAAGHLPYLSSFGEDSEVLVQIRDALILWGDPTPSDVLMAELVLAIRRSIAARQAAPISAKISKDCNFDKIAA